MNKRICDCCYNEIKDVLCQGYLHIPVAFYEYLVGNNPNMKQRIDKSKESLMISFFNSEPSTIDLDICGDCLRQLVELRKQMMKAIENGMLR